MPDLTGVADRRGASITGRSAKRRYNGIIGGASYDEIGRGYRQVRRPDPHIAARIEAALGDARSVLNAGAGTGSYEPFDREVIAVEPSAEMIAQRPAGSAPVVQASAEELPFDDDSFDAAMAIISVQHWSDLAAGLSEMRRVARQRVVVLTLTSAPPGDLWLGDYFPRALEIHGDAMPPIDDLLAMLPGADVEAVPVPRLCQDGFFFALWDRPEMHLDPEVRRGTSVWHSMPPEEVEQGLTWLRADLESGRWDERHGHLRSALELDVGVRLIRAELRGE